MIRDGDDVRNKKACLNFFFMKMRVGILFVFI